MNLNPKYNGENVILVRLSPLIERMDYLSIVPKDIRNLLQYYTNYENFEVAAEIYRKCLIIWEYIYSDEEEETKSSQLDSYLRNELGLKFTYQKIQFEDRYDGPHKCLKLILDPGQLVTLDVLTHLVRELCKKRNCNYMYRDSTHRIFEINWILCKNRTPLRIIQIILDLDRPTETSSHIVVNINDLSSANFINDLARGLLY
jgi:hypothetical protein